MELFSCVLIAVFYFTGDGYGVVGADVSGSGNLYVPVPSVGSMMNNQSLNTGSMQAVSRTTSPLVTNNQPNEYSTQQVRIAELQSNDQPEKMHFNSHYSEKDNLVQAHQQQQFQHPSHQFQHWELAQHQIQQKKQIEDQLLVKNDSFSHSQPSSKSMTGAEHHEEGLQAQVPGVYLSEMQNQLPQDIMDDHSRVTQLLSHQSGPQNVSSSLVQTSEQMQLVHPQQLIVNPQSEFSGLSGGIQPDAALRGQQYSRSQDAPVSGRLTLDKSVHDEFHHRLTGQDAAQPNNLSSEESVIGQSDTSRSVKPLNTIDSVYRSNNLTRERQFKNQQRWLLFLRHARRCPASEGKCRDPNCFRVQLLLKHMESCNFFQCTFPRCRATRVLINHNRSCEDSNCPVCVPVKNFVQAQFKAHVRSDLNPVLPSSVNGSCDSHHIAEITGSPTIQTGPGISETAEDPQPSIKRTKIEQVSQSLVSESECSVALASTVYDCHIQNVQHTEEQYDSHIPVKSEITEVKMEAPGSVERLSPKKTGMEKDNLDNAYIRSPKADPIAPKNPTGFGVLEVVKTEMEVGQSELKNTSAPSENTTKSGKPKIKGVSMIELFTPEEVRQHIMGLRQWVGQVSFVTILIVYRNRLYLH